MHTKADDIALRKLARACLRTLGLHRFWKLEDARWADVDPANDAESELDLIKRTISIKIGFHVEPRKLPKVLYHELFHLVTYPIEALVRRSPDETLKKAHDDATETAIEQIVQTVFWLLRKGRDA